MEYFAKSNGNENGLTLEHPGEFSELIQILKPGDTLYVLPGLYVYSRTIFAELHGEKEFPIKITAYSEAPIFDFRTQEYDTKIHNNGFEITGKFVELSDLVIRYAGYKGIYFKCDNSKLNNIEVYGCCDSGIQIKGGNNTIQNCKSHDNFGYKTYYLGKIAFGFSSDGISDKQHSGAPNTYINCESYNNTDDGFDFYERQCKGTMQLINCKSYNNGKKVVNMLVHPRYETDKEWFSKFAKGKIYDVLLSKSYSLPLDRTVKISIEEYPSISKGCGFKLGGNLNTANFILTNCVAENNYQYGFYRNSNFGEITYKDCVSENNKLKDYWPKKSSS